MKIAPGSRLVMIGDSITECGREAPPGEVPDDLGGGYVFFVDSLIRAAHPGCGIRIWNTGISGDTVRDLEARWAVHVLDLEPDWLSVMIGINDVWRQFDHWIPPSQQISLGEYGGTLDRLIGGVRPRVKGLVLMTPFLIEPDRTVPMRAMMDRYGAAVRSLAEKYRALVVDTQAAFDEALRELAPGELAADRVHVNAVGHMILARAFLKAVDFSW